MNDDGVYVACDLAAVETFKSPVGAVDAVEVAIIGRGGAAACRVVVVYRRTSSSTRTSSSPNPRPVV